MCVKIRISPGVRRSARTVTYIIIVPCVTVFWQTVRKTVAGLTRGFGHNRLKMFFVFYLFFLPHEKRHILTPSPPLPFRNPNDACHHLSVQFRILDCPSFRTVYSLVSLKMACITTLFLKPNIFRLKTPNVEKTKITPLCL